ncbi:unknown [Sinorhizobium phage PBC5]|nr:unknown [Sinorhizobium phage PBC5]
MMPPEIRATMQKPAATTIRPLLPPPLLLLRQQTQTLQARTPQTRAMPMIRAAQMKSRSARQRGSCRPTSTTRSRVSKKSGTASQSSSTTASCRRRRCARSSSRSSRPLTI